MLRSAPAVGPKYCKNNPPIRTRRRQSDSPAGLALFTRFDIGHRCKVSSNWRLPGCPLLAQSGHPNHAERCLLTLAAFASDQRCLLLPATQRYECPDALNDAEWPRPLKKSIGCEDTGAGKGKH